MRAQALLRFRSGAGGEPGLAQLVTGASLPKGPPPALRAQARLPRPRLSPCLLPTLPSLPLLTLLSLFFKNKIEFLFLSFSPTKEHELPPQGCASLAQESKKELGKGNQPKQRPLKSPKL